MAGWLEDKVDCALMNATFFSVCVDNNVTDVACKEEVGVSIVDNVTGWPSNALIVNSNASTVDTAAEEIVSATHGIQNAFAF